ncbi:hypothetical protein [Paenibacillus sp. L3-i20]|uniref:hypothetical protein n=1 Tax=Paenibacillus sp. L3-i20 TaxID=2905833 RepID=UPI00207EC08C|nr:hypothetical protein [Paenibacillus sp. L3-i20]GKU78099.1 hypothetical protein L3i20_v224960 [Paenibacillus sp. L3-i20]
MIETRIDRLEKYVIKLRKKPEINLIYAIAHKQDEEVTRAFNQLLAKHYNPQKQAVYKAIYGGYQKNITQYKAEIATIHSPKYRGYYETFVHIEEGNLALARKTAVNVPSVSMQHVLYAEIELQSGNRLEAIAQAKKALHSSKGLQLYQIYKEYERELPEALETT